MMPMTMTPRAVDTSQRADPTENLSGHELLETARRAVRQLRGAGHRPAWTRSAVEDTISDVVEACLLAQDQGTVVTTRYVYAVARNLVHRDRDLCSADARALRMLGERVAALEQAQGCEASPSQVDALAAEILETWDRPARRPTRGFHRCSVVVSLDAPAGDAASLAELIAAPEGNDAPKPPDESIDMLTESALAAHDKAGHSQVRRACWDTLARVHGVPTVTGPVTKHRVTRARSVIIRHPDGPEAAISEAMHHAAQGRHNALTDALFTPFTDAEHHERKKIVGLLRRYRTHAVDLWTAALSASSTAFYSSG